MSRIAYVNGRYLPLGRATVHVEDRGYQFADGVYEVCLIRNGHFVDEALHMARLSRSLGELKIRWPVIPNALAVIAREIVLRNGIRDGLLYIQITRGVAPRNHPFPSGNVTPTLVLMARSTDLAAGDRQAEEGVAVVTRPDIRWQRVDIKTVSLLPNVLAKQSAKEEGAVEAWLVDRDGFITEGSSTNAWIVSSDGVLMTRKASDGILRGVTRTVVFEMLDGSDIRFEERRFTVDEALAAREAFLTSAGNLVMPVISIDRKPIGGGKPGPIATELRRLFLDHAKASALRYTPQATNMSD